MGWDWSFAAEVLPLILQGLVLTLQLTVLGALFAFSLGLVFALLLRGPRPIALVVRGLIEFVRSTPLLVQVFFLFYVLPDVGVTVPAFWTGVFALGLHYATYTADTYRAGIDAVPAGQWEAATALSLPTSRVWTGVVLPQAIPRVLPALGNFMISMFKETPILISITLLDIVGMAREAGGRTFSYDEPYTIAGLFFLALSYPASLLVRRLERRVGTV
jgi:polar amino acid transport system permease protein